ncbi:MAG: methylaspartate mutase accessory protein GlmL [Ramlibacter sp.]|nr:methylaspartate mutase accessory protein GlmL [Ramlibacter sp.]
MTSTGCKVLVDIGSTFTKAVAVDIERKAVLATVKAPTSADTDVRIGIDQAMRALRGATGARAGTDVLACSSAAGGLRMISVGLVPQLSSEAARRAALGAGAKMVGHYSHELGACELAAIVASRPDIILLAGGTDGGNQKVILHNAAALAASALRVPVVIAGNRCARDEIVALFSGTGVPFKCVDNVMPEIGVLQVDPCRQAIREVFIDNIVHAKGLDQALSSLGGIVMPTPAAVLSAAVLLAHGHGTEPGLGEIVLIDLGGATTDVYSVARGQPTRSDVTLHGLPEPLAKRTVEGDLGVRHNLDTLIELCRARGCDTDPAIAAAFRARVQRIPDSADEHGFDAALAKVAVEVSFERHVGRVETRYGAHGEIAVQIGKDLSRVATVIGTGGPIVHGSSPGTTLRGVLAGSGDPRLLKPASARLLLDESYLMFAMGLLAGSHPELALMLMKRHLREL